MANTDLSGQPLENLLANEWLATNGLGCYASSTLANLHTRKYHGLLVAPMSPPHRRMVLLSRVEESFYLNGARYSLSANEYPDTIHPRGFEYLRAFNHDPFPRWAYQSDGWTIEKSLRFLQGQNTVVLCYTLLGARDPIDLELRPLFALRGIHELAYQWNGKLMSEEKSRRHHQIAATTRTPEVFFAHDGAFDTQPYWYLNTIYRRETERGYGGLEDLWSPGVIRSRLNPGQSLHLVCSTDPIDFDTAVIGAERQYNRTAAAIADVPVNASDPKQHALFRAADQFVTVDKQQQTAVIATYPWPSPSVRVALSSISGLLLIPGRYEQARSLIQHTFDHVRNGIAPSEFPEDGSAALYKSADASLWLIFAVNEYLRYTGDDETLAKHWLDPAVEILRAYRKGTDLGVVVDGKGLLTSKAPGVGTSWMDASLNGWVVTPRQGKPVELTALWYNALSTVADWADRLGRAELAADLRSQARTTRTGFNAAFWNESADCCFDVIDDLGRDPSIRPNQLLAIALPHPVLASEFHAAVMARACEQLLTPVGLRTLAPCDPNYQPRYAGNVISRDRAYHNGTVYPALLGWYVRGMMQAQGRSESTAIDARELIDACLERVVSTGQLCELFDGDAPHTPGGAPASARAVGELLRCYVEDVLGVSPSPKADQPSPNSPRVPQNA
jgi:predicted glycogen debranching enzyme